MNRESVWEDHLRLAVSYLILGQELEIKPQMHAIIESKFQQHFNAAEIIAKESESNINVLRYHPLRSAPTI
jgi:hypothetical protein